MERLKQNPRETAALVSLWSGIFLFLVLFALEALAGIT